MKQQIQLRRREVDETADLPAELPPLLRRLYASRGVRSAQELERSVKGMLPWQQLSGVEKAVEILYNAFREGTRIIVVGDFDADGATSTALSVLAMRSLGCSNIDYLVPNRFEDGYGLSPEVVDQAHARGAQLIVTVDNGISSHVGVEHARSLGIPVIVTDHHLPGDTLPAAEAIINPNLRDCNFPSKSLAGVGVAFYLMLALRTFLRDQGWFDERGIAIPNLAELLDLVALGTVADVVPLDANNRILTWQGMSRIRAGKCRPGIKALLYAMIGAVLGTGLSFLLAKLLGRDFLHIFFGEEKMSYYIERLNSKQAYAIVFFLYLIPGIPKDMVSYAAGASEMRFKPFILLSAVGRLPGMVGCLLIGSMVESGNYVGVGVLLAIAVIACILCIVFRKRINVFLDKIYNKISK